MLILCFAASGIAGHCCRDGAALMAEEPSRDARLQRTEAARRVEGEGGLRGRCSSICTSIHPFYPIIIISIATRASECRCLLGAALELLPWLQSA